MDNDKKVGLWELDIIARKSGWRLARPQMQEALDRVIDLADEGADIALVIDADDEGAETLRRAESENVVVFGAISDYRYYVRRQHGFAAVVLVSPRKFDAEDIPCVHYYPVCLHLGVGCQRQASPTIARKLLGEVNASGFSSDAIATIGSIDTKKDEPLMRELKGLCPKAELHFFPAEALAKVKIPNPSDKVFESSGCYGVAEAAALIENEKGKVLIERQKKKIEVGGKIQHYTFALSR